MVGWIATVGWIAIADCSTSMAVTVIVIGLIVI
jgi:hypothetical protein